MEYEPDSRYEQLAGIIRAQQFVIDALTKALLAEQAAHQETRYRAQHDPLIPTMLNKAETEGLISRCIERHDRLGLCGRQPLSVARRPGDPARGRRRSRIRADDRFLADRPVGA